MEQELTQDMKGLVISRVDEGSCKAYRVCEENSKTLTNHAEKGLVLQRMEVLERRRLKGRLQPETKGLPEVGPGAESL